MVELHITMTGKGYSPKEEFRTFADKVKRFPDLPAAKAWLKENYGNSKRSPMYRDQKNGPPQVVGYVIGFRNADYAHTPVYHYIQQDWIEFRECKALNLDGDDIAGKGDT